MWTLLRSCAFILSTAYFQFVNGVVIHTPLECWTLVLPNVLHILQKAPPQSSSYCSQKNSFSHFLEYFLTDVDVDVLHCLFEGPGPNCSSSESSLLLLPCLEANEDVEPKKKRISILHNFSSTKSVDPLYTTGNISMMQFEVTIFKTPTAKFADHSS